MKKSLPVIVSVALVLVTLLSGCVVESEPTPTLRPDTTPILKVVPTLNPEVTPTKPSQKSLQGVVTIWHSFEDVDAQAMEKIIEAFTEEYPKVGFRVTFVPDAEIKQRFEEIVPTGGGPDLVVGLGEWAPEWWDERIIQDITPLALDPAFWDTIDPLAFSFVRRDGLTLGLPLTMRGVVLFRNTAIIPEAPATWEDLVAAAQAASSGDVAGARLDRGFLLSGAHLIGLGGSFMDEAGEPTFADEKGLAWLDLLRSYEEADPHVTINNIEEAIDAFAEGKVGFLIGTSELIPRFEDAIGAENLAIDPWPTYGDGSLSGFVQTNTVYMSKNATYFKQTISWEFMQYLMGETAQSLFAANRHIPTRAGVTAEDPLLQEAAEIIREGQPLLITSHFATYITELEKALVAVFEEGQDPEGALNTAAEAIRSAVTGLP